MFGKRFAVVTRGWRGSVHCQPVFNAGSVLLSSLPSLSLSLPLDFLSFVLAFFRWQHLSSAFSPLSILSLSLSLSLSSFLCLFFVLFCFVLFSIFLFFSIASVQFEQGSYLPKPISEFRCLFPYFFILQSFSIVYILKII